VIPLFWSKAMILTILTYWWWWWIAVFALLSWTACWIFCVKSLIILARFFRDTNLMSELINTNWISSFTVPSSFTIDDGLWTESQIWPSIVS